jgi:hypothetical protein
MQTTEPLHEEHPVDKPLSRAIATRRQATLEIIELFKKRVFSANPELPKWEGTAHQFLEEAGECTEIVKIALKHQLIGAEKLGRRLAEVQRIGAPVYSRKLDGGRLWAFHNPAIEQLQCPKCLVRKKFEVSSFGNARCPECDVTWSAIHQVGVRW